MIDYQFFVEVEFGFDEFLYTSIHSQSITAYYYYRNLQVFGMHLHGVFVPVLEHIVVTDYCNIAVVNDRKGMKVDSPGILT
jgi:hypothetical protein